VGREAMRERLAIIVSDSSDLADRLKRWSQSESADRSGFSDREVYRGGLGIQHPRAGDPAAPHGAAGAERSLQNIAQQWVAGAAENWESLYDKNPPRRISLPTYPFARERFWVSNRSFADSGSASSPHSAQLHPLVSHNCSTLNDISFNSRLPDTAFYATDHTVRDERIFPGAGFLEIAGVCGSLAAEQRVRKIRDVVWIHPLSFGEGPKVLRTYVKHIGEAVEYAITSFGDDNEQLVHSEGRLLFSNDDGDVSMVESNAEEGMRIESLQGRCKEYRSGDEFYRGFATQGLVYGPGLRVVRELHSGDSCVLARMQLPDHLRREFSDFVLHPALIDGALQTVGALFAAAGPKLQYLPFALDEVDLLRPLTQNCYAFAESVQPQRQGGSRTRKFNIQIFNEKGVLLVRLNNLHMMPLDEALAGHGLRALR
jgi:polyketide synthase PksL